MVWSVDKFGTIPSIFSMASSSSSSIFSVINPQPSDIGTYTIRLLFTSTFDSSVYSSETFLVTINPEIPYN